MLLALIYCGLFLTVNGFTGIGPSLTSLRSQQISISKSSQSIFDIPPISKYKKNAFSKLGSSTKDEEKVLESTMIDEEEETDFFGMSTSIYWDENEVICARGVCVIPDDDMDFIQDGVGDDLESAKNSNILSFSFIWPRALLLVCSILYGANFPLGRIMNDALPASATTSTRMFLATLSLSPFLFKIDKKLAKTAMICGTFTALGYITQSVALIDTSAATVSFLGALVVIVCPALAYFIDKKKMGFADQPQTWIAAVLCIVGVGLLELGGDPNSSGEIVSGIDSIGWGDFLSVLQAVGFGTSFFITERMMAKEPKQALPITAFQCAMTALLSGVWALLDGTGALGGFFAFGQEHTAWLLDESTRSTYTIPGLLFEPTMRTVAGAACFTAFITTAGNRVCETSALGKVTSNEASVLLATEPLWAALFASFLIGETLGVSDAIGGFLIVIACATTAIQPEWLREKFNIQYDEENQL